MPFEIIRDACNAANKLPSLQMSKVDIWIVFYWLSEDSEFNYLAAFDSEEKANEYKNRNVWSHLKTFVSKQPVY